MVTQNKTLRFSKSVKWITILYGKIPQQVDKLSAIKVSCAPERLSAPTETTEVCINLSLLRE